MFLRNTDIPLPLWQNGPEPGSYYDFPARRRPQTEKSNVLVNNDFHYFGISEADDGRQRLMGPVTTGASVVGIVFDNGVILAADTKISYGTLSRFENIDRVFRVNKHIIIGMTGDYADFQYIKRFIDQKENDDYCHDDKIEMKPKSLYNWLTRILYNRRCNFRPLWLDIIVGGMQDGVPFLGHINLRGSSYMDRTIATGLGKHIAVPLLREITEKPNASVTQNDAIGVIKKCMEVLFYRDCLADQKYTMAICNATEGAKVEGPFVVEQNWSIAKYIKT